MNTKLLLTASALVMGAAGIAGSFAPDEIAALLDLPPAGALRVILQLLAALLFAFAMVNWLARGSLIGGIYNRPVAVGNVTHFVIGAFALAKLIGAGDAAPRSSLRPASTPSSPSPSPPSCSEARSSRSAERSQARETR